MSERRLWGVMGLLALLVVLSYAGALQVPFVYDDRIEVIGNRTIQSLEQWQLILGYNLSRPITIGSYALSHAVHGESVLGYHLLDLAIHLLNTGLVLLLSWGLARLPPPSLSRHPAPLWLAGLSAGIWALHPLATESVTYITGRSEQLSATFMLLGAWAWVRWLQSERHSYAVLAWLAALLGVFSKENAVVLPILMLAIEALVARQGLLRSVRWRSYWPAAIGGVAFFALRLWLYGSLTSPGEPLRGLDTQLPTQALAWLLYARLAALPYSQRLFHAPPVHGLDALTLSAMALWSGLGVGAVMLRKRLPILVLGFVWWSICLAPSSSFVALKETAAEHRTYLALLGPALVLSWWLASRRVRALGLPLMLLLAGLTFKRNQTWSSEVRLWQDATRVNPDAAEAWYALADAKRMAGETDGSRRAYKRALALDPGYTDAWNNLGMLEADAGRIGEAELAWREALRSQPSYCPAHNNLGKLYAQQGHFQDAEIELNTTLSKCPMDCTAHRLLGELYAVHGGEKQLAVRHYEAFLEICPSHSWSAEVRSRLTRLTW